MGEARELGRRYTCSDELALLQDESVECVSRRLRELAHAPVKEEAPVQEELVQLEKPVEPKAPTLSLVLLTFLILNLILVEIW